MRAQSCMTTTRAPVNTFLHSIGNNMRVKTWFVNYFLLLFFFFLSFSFFFSVTCAVHNIVGGTVAFSPADRVRGNHVIYSTPNSELGMAATLATYTCTRGKLIGNPTRKCVMQYAGKVDWAGDLPICGKSLCLLIESIHNPALNMSGAEYQPKHTCTAYQL